MKKKESLFIKIINLITYKKKKKPKKFSLPEIDEGKAASRSERNLRNVPTYDSRKSTSYRSRRAASRANKPGTNDISFADDKTISKDIKANIDYINNKFNAPANRDIIIRQFVIESQYQAFIAYLDGMVDKTIINSFILRPLLQGKKSSMDQEECRLDYIMNQIIETNQTKKVTTPDEVVSEILSGNTCLYVDGCDFYITSETKGFEKRSVTNPLTEGVVKGPQEGFSENLRTNITLVRRIIKNNNLTTEFVKIGELSNTMSAIVYVQGIVNPALVKEVKRRIAGIKTDALFSSGMLEQFVEDSPWSIVPTVLSTERPDRAASHISEGRVAVFLDGTPFAFVVPVTLHSLFHTPEDAALRWQHATLIRYVRFAAVILATLLPGVYVAMTTFHKEMIPTELLIAIAKAKENVPFPTIVELFLMELSFELIREAGIRIPGIVGNTLGIIGALILGQAAVEANIVSPILIIVIAVGGLGNFAIPNFDLAFGVRILRFFFIFAGGFLGFFGISAALVVLGIMIVTMTSFGIPFYSATAPKTRKSFDLLAKWPVWSQKLRPDSLNTVDEVRQPEVSRKWTQENPESSSEEENSNE